MAPGPNLKPIAQSLWRHPGARRRLSLAPRISVAVYAIVIAPWVELSTIAVWLAGIAAWEILALPRLRPLLQSSARGTWRARLAESFLNAFGSVLYAWGLWVAMANAGPGGAFLAGLWTVSTVIQALTYYSASRLQFAAASLPFLIGTTIIELSFISTAVEPAPAWSVVLTLAHLIAISLLAVWDRNTLLASLTRTRSEKQVAIDANKAKSHFVAIMSHELRTPLNAVIGYAELLKEDIADNGAADPADVDKITSAASRLLMLIDQILDWSQIEAGLKRPKPTSVSISEVVAAVVESTSTAARAGDNRVHVAIEQDVGTALTDRDMLYKCLHNLVSNACKFTTNGDIRITISAPTRDEKRLMRAIVSDTGVGISPADAPKLFQPFSQVDESFTRGKDGAGLGLSVARKLAQLLGGDITFESAPGSGSTFELIVLSDLDNASASRTSAK